MKKNFYDIHQATMYLEDSIVRRGRMPIHIKDVHMLADERNKFKLYYNVLGNEDMHNCFWPDAEINLNPVPLGYVNINDYPHPLLVCRKPARKWKIGLYRNNVEFFSTNGKRLGSREYVSVIYGLGMKNTILNEYPKLNTAIEVAKKTQGTHAFSRRFAVSHDEELYYKTSGVVGELGRENYFFKEFSFLREVFHEDTGL